MTPSWTNWSGSVACQPKTIERPASEAELVALIHQAREADYTVRVAGSGHSFVPLCASGGMLAGGAAPVVERAKRGRGGIRTHE